MNVRINDIASVHKQIREFQEKIRVVTHLENLVFIDDLYEYLLIARPAAMNEKITDAAKCSAEHFRKTPDKNPLMKNILAFFPGKTSLERRIGLKNFLLENPAYKTSDLNLLLQRLQMRDLFQDILEREDIEERPIKDAIARIKDIRVEEEPNDNDFLN